MRDAHAGSDIRVNETLVLGLGNPLRGDDGLGPAVIRWLQARGLPSGVTAVDGGTSGLELVLTLAGDLQGRPYRRALIVDAADLGRAPGEWVRFTPEQVRLRVHESALSLHAAGLAEALALGEALGTLPREVVLFGVQPASVDWSPGLSTQAQVAVPVVADAVLQEIGSQHGQDSDH
jgi:hydrogenase maturation protease